MKRRKIPAAAAIATVAAAVALVAVTMVVTRGATGAGSRAGAGADVAPSPAAANGTSPAVAAAAADAAGDDAIPAEMRQQMADVARAYADGARFPDYARPLSAEDWHWLNPRPFVARAAALDGLPGVTATVEIAHAIADRDAPLPVRVRVSGSPGAGPLPVATAVRVVLKRRDRQASPVALAPSGNGSAAGDAGGASQVFAGEVPVSVLHALPEGEAAVIAQLSFDNGMTAVATAALNLYAPAARLVDVGTARVEGADLVIPARFDVKRPGQYRVQANLFAAEDRAPVSHVTAEFLLSAQDSGGELRVHAVTLRARGIDGPYVLRDVDIQRIPDQPGDPTGYGSSLADNYAVNGFPLDAYSPEPYEDPAARQRLEFLQKLANTP